MIDTNPKFWQAQANDMMHTAWKLRVAGDMERAASIGKRLRKLNRKIRGMEDEASSTKQ